MNYIITKFVAGKHPCLLCLITKEEIRQPKSTRTNVPKRTLTSLKEDLHIFQVNGGNVRDAKIYRNIIYQKLFDLPIDQVNVFFCECLLIIPSSLISH